jgi:hypothetical protein
VQRVGRQIAEAGLLHGEFGRDQARRARAGHAGDRGGGTTPARVRFLPAPALGLASASA